MTTETTNNAENSIKAVLAQIEKDLNNVLSDYISNGDLKASQTVLRNYKELLWCINCESEKVNYLKHTADKMLTAIEMYDIDGARNARKNHFEGLF